MYFYVHRLVYHFYVFFFQNKLLVVFWGHNSIGRVAALHAGSYRFKSDCLQLEYRQIGKAFVFGAKN